MDRRILILSNPTSGSYSTRFVDLVRRGIESHGGHSELQATTSVEDLRTRAKAAVGTWDVVAAYGGDGTINHVAAAVLGSPIGVGVIPGGTANVMARELAVPRQPFEVGAMLATARPSSAPVGLVNDQVFLMMVGVGLDGEAVRRVSPTLKRFTGRAAYGVAAFSAAFVDRGVRLELDVDGLRCRPAWAVITRIRRYGGEFVMAPAASPWTDTLQVVTFARRGPLALVRHVAAAATGSMAHYQGAEILEGRRVLVSGPEGAAVQVDGDPYVGPPLEIRTSALSVHWIAPPPMSR